MPLADVQFCSGIDHINSTRLDLAPEPEPSVTGSYALCCSDGAQRFWHVRFGHL